MRDGRPWGLNGPEFLLVYAVALAVVCGVIMFVRGAARGREFRNDDHVELTTYERAYLNGGAHRVADAALAGLIASGGVRASRRGDLSIMKPGKARDEYQQLVVDGIQTTDRTIDQVRNTVRFRGEIEPLVRSLRERGLIVSRRSSAVVFGARLLIPLLAAVGVARLVNGAGQGYPVGFLLLELFATWIAWTAFADTCAHPMATSLGEAVKLGDPVPEDRADSFGEHRRFRKFVARDEQGSQRDAALAVGDRWSAGLFRHALAETVEVLRRLRRIRWRWGRRRWRWLRRWWRVSEPWGLTGPAFLVLYGFALLLACGAVAVAYSRARRPSFQGEVPVELDTYERAYLNGGAHRVADTAVAALIAAHKVRITRQREMAFVGPKEPENGFEQLVREHLDGRSKIADVRRAVRRSGACEPLQRSLRDQKLLVPAAVHRRLVAVTALFPLLMAIGVARAVEGSALGRPIGDLDYELLLGGIAWWFAAMACRHPIATRFGEAVKSRDPLPESYWPATDRPRRYRPFAPADLARLEGLKPLQNAADIVAVEGLSSYPNRDIARLLEPSRTGGGAGFAGGSGGGGCGG